MDKPREYYSDQERRRQELSEDRTIRLGGRVMDTVAILARTNRALRAPEEVLSAAGVKYHLLSKCGFWSQQEVKAVLAYLQCVIYPADYALAGAIRAPFHPSKFLPKTKLLAALKTPLNPDDATMTSHWYRLTQTPNILVESKNLEAINQFVSHIHSLSRYRNLPAADAVKSVLGSLKVGDVYADASDTPDNDPLANLSDLVRLAGKFSDLKGFLDYARKATAASKGKKGICLATCHAAKGTEYHTVYLIGCQEGLMPHEKATDLDEERNIFFVGCSRAERRLVITYSGVPSPFLKGVKCENTNPNGY